MSFQSMMSSSQLPCLCIILWPRGRPEWVTFWKHRRFCQSDTGGRSHLGGGNWLYLDEPGVVQSVPQLQDLLLDHRRLVHLVPENFMELQRRHRFHCGAAL